PPTDRHTRSLTRRSSDLGALIDAVGDAVFVRIQRAPGRVDRDARGRVGTLIDTIGHAVSVGVDRTALRVHVRPRRRAGALIDAVGRKSTRLNSSHRTTSY